MQANGKDTKVDALTKFVPRSTNRKLGPMPCSYVEKSTCPASCPLMGAGCYGEAGPVSIHWNNVKTPWRAFLGQVGAIPAGVLWRHAVAGDLPGKSNSIDTGQLWQLIHANGQSRGFAYTHKPLSHSLYRQTIKRINENTPFTINLSADSLPEADTKASWKVGPVVVVLPSETVLSTKTPAGRHVMICPATYNANVNCQNCGICAKAGRDFIVGFPAHGNKKRLINERIEQNRQGEVINHIGV